MGLSGHRLPALAANDPAVEEMGVAFRMNTLGAFGTGASNIFVGLALSIAFSYPLCISLFAITSKLVLFVLCLQHRAKAVRTVEGLFIRKTASHICINSKNLFLHLHDMLTILFCN